MANFLSGLTKLWRTAGSTSFEGEIPALPGYFPSVADMDSNQLRFYRHLERKLKRGEYVDVKGEIGYVFAFVYGYIRRWNESGFESLHEFLTHLAELYVSEAKLSEGCRYWARDCLLGLGKYELFLERTAPKSVLRTRGHRANLRLNLQRHLGLPADPIDIVTLNEPRKSKIIDANEAAYRDCVVKVFRAYEREHGSWYRVLEGDMFGRGDGHVHTLFAGVAMRQPRLPIEMRTYYSDDKGIEVVKRQAREAENALRAELGIPLVGEGWVSETQLYKRLAEEFPETPVIHHGSPPWLGLQHLDIWFPDWRLGVEYHGKQHFEPVEFFGGEEALEKTRERDERKARLCRKHRVTLIVVTEDDDVEHLVQSIRDHYRKLREGTRAPA